MLIRSSPESPRLFESDWIDVLSRTPWWVIPLIWLPITGLMISLSIDRLSTSQLFGGFFTGYLIWTFSEYLLHRTLFHWIAPFRWGPRLQFILHGVHHEFPNDCFRLVMPPALGIIISIPFMITFRVIFGPAWFGIIVAGFFFSYLVYDMIHYTTHHLKWKNQIFQKLKSHHMLHHFSPNHKNRKYGVSSTMWDRIFRTY